MRVIKNGQKEPKLPNLYQYPAAKPWKGRLVNRIPFIKNLFGRVGLITILGIVAMMSRNTYIYKQNGLIEKINCHVGENIDGILHDINYYNNVPEDASNQYCLGEIYKIGNGPLQSLTEARKWYKKAADQGLTVAKNALCVPEMFEVKISMGDSYSEFRSLCCLGASFHSNTECPWYDENGLLIEYNPALESWFSSPAIGNRPTIPVAKS